MSDRATLRFRRRPFSGVREGVFCSAWTLVVAAREIGKLNRLKSDLGPLVEKRVPNAELLMALAQMADDRSNVAQMAERIRHRMDQLKASLAEWRRA